MSLCLVRVQLTSVSLHHLSILTSPASLKDFAVYLSIQSRTRIYSRLPLRHLHLHTIQFSGASHLLSSSCLSLLLVVALGTLISQEDFSGQIISPSFRAACARDGPVEMEILLGPCLSLLSPCEFLPGSLSLSLPRQALGM